jgi:hypothetical protein
MFAYHEKTTDELIDLLTKEEDRVTLEHIQELIARPDAVEPLREILRDDFYWYEAKNFEWWVEYHAFTILSATRNPELLPDLLNALRPAYKTCFDYLTEIAAVALAYFGEQAVEPLMRFVIENQGRHRDNSSCTYLRTDAVTALTRIALEHPASRRKVTDFLCSLLTDPKEDDPEFLGFIVDDAVTLDRERGLAAAREAYERKAIDESICGNYQQMVKFSEEHSGPEHWPYTQDLFEFYHPEQIAARQEQWAKEKEEEERSAAKKRKEELARAARPSPPPAPPAPAPYVAPDGYSQTEDSALVRQEKIGRNDPCPCGSGKKYKKCCGK